MKFKGDGIAAGLRRAATVLLTAGLLAACGGGDQVKTFEPTRVVAFGDENSVIEDVNSDRNGRKYTVNAVVASDVTTLDCTSFAIWTQVLASHYNLQFAECDPLGSGARASKIYAQPGAKVADISTQIDQFLADGQSFSGTDLVTVMVGANDLFDLYATYVGGDAEQGLATARQLGNDLAAQVNRLANAGAKVLISTVPNLGRTPFATAEELKGPGRASFLADLSDGINETLRLGIINDGRKIGLLLNDELLGSIAQFPASYGFTDGTLSVCDPALAPTVETCTTQTLLTGRSAVTFLWADDRHMSPGAHGQVGNLAITRATGNPF